MEVVTDRDDQRPRVGNMRVRLSRVQGGRCSRCGIEF